MSPACTPTSSDVTARPSGAWAVAFRISSRRGLTGAMSASCQSDDSAGSPRGMSAWVTGSGSAAGTSVPSGEMSKLADSSISSTSRPSASSTTAGFTSNGVRFSIWTSMVMACQVHLPSAVSPIGQ